MMPAKNEDLHGNAPDECCVAILIVDMINDFEFPGGQELFSPALPAAQNISRLKQRAAETGVPVIYANDNFGKWRSSFQDQLRHCLDDHVRGEPIARLLQPARDDYFVLKAKHSSFYATPLDLLLTYLKVRTLIITGVSSDVCILFTASDAYMRDYQLFVPEDCTASMTQAQNRQALEQMKSTLDADIRPSEQLDLAILKKPQ
jgi:nicotinamidase-related amidase